MEVLGRTVGARFTELAKLCDGDDPKSDKSSILLDAIRVVKQQRVEMDQLKQLNKFLEVGARRHLICGECEASGKLSVDVFSKQ